MIRRAFFVSLGIVVLTLLTLGGAAPTTPDPLTNLQRKYSWGSIFLTYSTLADLANTFQNKQLMSSLTTHVDAYALGLLKRFVTQHTSVRYGESAAFLQLDLAAQRAGFMPTNAVDGTVTPLPWSAGDVGRVALLLDKFLTANSTAIAFTSGLAKRKDVANSWQQLTALSENPLVSARIAWTAKKAFRQFIEVRAGDLKQLRVTDPALVQQLDEFRHHVDSEIAMVGNHGIPEPRQRYIWRNHEEYSPYATTTSTTGSYPGWYGSLSTAAMDTGWFSTSMTSTFTTAVYSTDGSMSNTSTSETNGTETTSTRP